MDNPHELVLVSRDQRVGTSVTLLDSATDNDCAFVSALPDVVSVAINGGAISDEGFSALCQIGSIEDLSIRNMPGVSDVGAKALASRESQTHGITSRWTCWFLRSRAP